MKKESYRMGDSRDQLYSQDSKRLARSSFAAIGGVLLSRASGVVRTVVVNASFGASISTDAFNAAFRFPNALRDLFADGALSSAFIKVLVDAREKGVEEEKKLISIVIGFFTFVTLVISLLCAIFSWEFMDLISSEKFKISGGHTLSSNLFKILAFYLPITMLNAVAMASLGVLGKTFRATNASLFLSVGMIIGSLLLGPCFEYFQINSIFGLALGAMLGALFQLIYQFIPLFKLNLIQKPIFNIKTWIAYEPLKEVLILMVPRAIGQGALTLALLINTMFAIQVGKGVLTYIVTAMVIIQVPIGLFGVATGFAALPILSKTINEKNFSKFSALLAESLETCMWLALFTSIAFALFIVPFYHFIFQHGKITYFDTIQNSIAVCSYSIGIVFSAGSKILLGAFYALNKTKQILYNAFIYLLLSACLSSYLAPKYGIIGLGLSYGIATSTDFFINFYFIKTIYKKMNNEQKLFYTNGKRFLIKIIIFSLLGYVVGLSGIMLILKFWSQLNSLSGFYSFCILSGGGIIYGIICLTMLYFFGTNNLNLFIKAIIQRVGMIRNNKQGKE